MILMTLQLQKPKVARIRYFLVLNQNNKWKNDNNDHAKITNSQLSYFDEKMNSGIYIVYLFTSMSSKTASAFFMDESSMNLFWSMVQASPSCFIFKNKTWNYILID
jgi:hypothetical protein